MRTARPPLGPVVAALAVVLLAALAPTALAEGPSAPAPDASTVEVPESAEVESRAWEFNVTGFAYHGNGESAYAYATFMADRDRLHLEARWAYEDRETASLWVGMNFEVGTSLVLEATPIVGGVFGETEGIAVGFEATLTWRRFELYTEAEYLHHLADASNSYTYSWTELSYRVTDTWRVGLVAQRTRAYESDLELQRGVLLGLTVADAEITAYVIDVGLEEPMVAVSLSVDF